MKQRSLETFAETRKRRDDSTSEDDSPKSAK